MPSHLTLELFRCKEEFMVNGYKVPRSCDCKKAQINPSTTVLSSYEAFVLMLWLVLTTYIASRMELLITKSPSGNRKNNFHH